MSDTPSNGIPPLQESDWDQVHQQIQAILADAADRIRARWSAIASSAGRTTGTVFQLFSFQRFETKDPAGTEPVILGIEIWDKEDHYLVSGDVSAEESGEIFFDEGCQKQSEKNLDSVLTAVSEVAKTLADQWERIPEALTVSVTSDQ